MKHEGKISAFDVKAYCIYLYFYILSFLSRCVRISTSLNENISYRTIEIGNKYARGKNYASLSIVSKNFPSE